MDTLFDFDLPEASFFVCSGIRLWAEFSTSKSNPVGFMP